eukprot:GDKI01023382.1.p1 GENE.GDKI01023382.1~~GDKI01023382.1.p1  ORF type:complete len:178 (-),score=15.38 GDKI01023382.1:168-701(-)
MTHDELWSCEYIEDMQVQQKSSQWHQVTGVNNVYCRVGVSKNAGLRTHQPYMWGDFEFLWVTPPPNAINNPLFCCIESKYQHFFIDKYSLDENAGVLANPTTGAKGKQSMYVESKQLLERRAEISGAETVKPLTYGFTADYAFDSEKKNWERSRAMLLGVIKRFAKRSGRLCKFTRE